MIGINKGVGSGWCFNVHYGKIRDHRWKNILCVIYKKEKNKSMMTRGMPRAFANRLRREKNVRVSARVSTCRLLECLVRDSLLLLYRCNTSTQAHTLERTLNSTLCTCLANSSATYRLCVGVLRPLVRFCK